MICKNTARPILIGVAAGAALIWVVACAGGLDPVPDDGSPPGADVTEPYPIDRGDMGVSTPGKYKGLWLRLVDTGEPAVSYEDDPVPVVCIGMLESEGSCRDFVARITSHWINHLAENVVVINCGRSEFGMESWIDPDQDHQLWQLCLRLLREWFSLRPDEVRVVYYRVGRETLGGPDGLPLPTYPNPGAGYWMLKNELTALSRRTRNFFPGVQAVYLSSRSYRGFGAASSPGPSEPASYEEGHAVNSWLSENPVVDGVWHGWGAYEWAPPCDSGVTNGQEICYDRLDYREDGIVPSPAGYGKTSWQMHHRLLRERWYRSGN